MNRELDKVFFTLISPIYNEKYTIRELVERSVNALNSSPVLKGKKWNYILVDDCSTDSSPQIISELMSEYSGIVIGVRHKKRLGQGGALKTGFFLGQCQVFGTLDSDLEKQPEDTLKLLEEYVSNNCDVVTTYLKEKNFISRTGNAVLRAMFHHKTQQASTNQMVIGATFVHRVNLINNDQRYVLPIAMSLGARKIGEVETAYIPRRCGRSKYHTSLKIFQGFPEMLILKWRLYKKFYHKRLDDKYRTNFEFIQLKNIH